MIIKEVGVQGLLTKCLKDLGLLREEGYDIEIKPGSKGEAADGRK